MPKTTLAKIAIRQPSPGASRPSDGTRALNLKKDEVILAVVRLRLLISCMLFLLANAVMAQRYGYHHAYRSSAYHSYHPTRSYHSSKSYAVYPKTYYNHYRASYRSSYSSTRTYHSSASHRSTYAAYAPRDERGRIKRSSSAREEFMRMSGYPHGRPGYVIDHIIPLKKGGCDCPSNMQWQTKAAAKAKDKWE